MELYRRPDNPLLIPEIRTLPPYARFFFLALGHETLGFSPFGIDFTTYTNFPLGAKKMDDGSAGPLRAQLPARRPDDARARAARLRRKGQRRRREEGDARADPGASAPGRSTSPTASRSSGSATSRPGTPSRSAAPSSPSSATTSSWWWLPLPRRLPDDCRRSEEAARLPARRGRDLRQRQVQGPAPLERRPDRLGPQLHLRPRGPPGDAGDVLVGTLEGSRAPSRSIELEPAKPSLPTRDLSPPGPQDRSRRRTARSSSQLPDHLDDEGLQRRFGHGRRELPDSQR